MNLMQLNLLRRPWRSPVPAQRASRRRGWVVCASRSLVILGVASLVVGCTGLPFRSPSEASRHDGFFGWHFQAPFDTSDVKTVCVQFRTQSFRRGIELQLTEAVTKEIN